jgi:tetratricopeptide (TPR) repeat protein
VERDEIESVDSTPGVSNIVKKALEAGRAPGMKIEKDPYIVAETTPEVQPPYLLPERQPSISSIIPIESAGTQPKPPLIYRPHSSRSDNVKLVVAEMQSSHINNLQQIKLQLMNAGQTDAISQIHELEGSMMKLISMEESAKQGGLGSLSGYHEAEALMVNKDYISALQKYYSVIAEDPKNYFAFLSHYQIANIQLEALNNFSDALSEYQYCLQNYPDSYFTGQQRKDIMDRIALLKENAVDGWRPLRLYLQAGENNADVGIVLYRELLEQYPQLNLTRKAVDQIIQNALSTGYEDASIPSQVISMFQACQNKVQNTGLKQQIQMGIADILNYRFFQHEQALLEYTRVIQIDPHSNLSMMARQRIKEIYNSKSIHTVSR